MAQNLIIFGSGGHALSAADVALEQGFNISCFVNPLKKSESLLGFPIVSEIPKEYANGLVDAFIAIGDNNLRSKKYKELKVKYPDFVYPNLIHPRAALSKQIKIGFGSIVFAGCSINIGSSIGNFCIINTNSSVDHECVLDNFVSLAPGVNLGGRVKIQEKSFLGIGASIKQGVNISSNVLVGANSYVNTDVPSNVMVLGTPAKVAKDRDESENFF